MKLTYIHTLWVLVFLTLATSALPLLVQAEYYVSLNGSDSNPGTINLPWRTIQKAANTMNPSETTLIQSGYFDEFVTITRSGTAENQQLIFKSEKQQGARCKGFLINGDFITLDGFEVEADAVTRWIGIQVSGRTNVTVQNCYVQECPNGGIRFNSTTNAKILTNTLVHNGQSGIHISGTNGLVEGNFITRTVQYHPKGLEPGFSGADADGFRIFGTQHIIRRNRVINIAEPTDAGNIDPHPDCIQTWDNVSGTQPVMSNTVIEGNYFCVSNPTGKGIMIEAVNGRPCHHLTIRNNIFEFRDIGISAYAGAYNDIFIYNNVFKSMRVQTPWGTSVALTNITNYAVLNNIMVDCHTQYRSIQGGSGTVDYNLAWSSDGSNFTLVPPLQSHEIRGVDPRFVTYTGNHNENNYHLQSGSPAQNQGVNLADVVADFDGVARPQGTGLDIGPYEFVATETPYSSTEATANIARWKDNKTGALILGFDDSTPGQALLGVPALNARHLVGTWYVNPGTGYYDDNRATWETIAPAGGQELANHTMHHSGASTYAETVIEVGDAAQAIWQIRNQLINGSLIAFNRGGGTTWNETDLANVLADFHNIDRLATLGPGIAKQGLSVIAGSTADTMYDFVPPIIAGGNVAVLRFHGICATNGTPPMDNGNAGVWINEFTAFLDQLANIKSQAWNCGEIQLYKYCRERLTATISIAQYSETRFKVQLLSTLDETYYDEPLTLLISDLPSSWSQCIVSHEGNETTVPVNNRVAMFDTRPNKGDITLYAVLSTSTPGLTQTPTAITSTTLTPTPTISLTATQTPTRTSSATFTSTRTSSPTRTISATRTHSPTCTPTASITPTQTISATITLTPTMTPTSTLAPTLTVTSVRGELDLKGRPFLVYPNPTKGKMTLVFQPAGTVDAKVQIYNMNGERVAELSAEVNSDTVVSVTWDCSSVAPGLYVVRVMQDGKEIGESKVAVVR